MFIDSFVTNSGAKVFESGLINEEDDSALAINDLQYDNGKDAGYIMVSPSGRNNYAKAVKRSGEIVDASFPTYLEAKRFIVESL